MNLFRRWFWPFSCRNKVLSLYKLGMARIEKKDSQGAIAAFTMAIEQPGAPDDVSAMALYNRALLFDAIQNTDRASADLRSIMKMPAALYDVRLAAKRRLQRLQNRYDTASRLNGRPT